MNLNKVREGILLAGAVAAILWLILATSALVATAIWRGDENVKEIQETENRCAPSRRHQSRVRIGERPIQIGER